MAASVFLHVGSYLFTLPLLLAVLVRGWSLLREGHLPAAIHHLPGFAAVGLFAPNLALIFLGSGLEALALVAVLTVMVVELWI